MTNLLLITALGLMSGTLEAKPLSGPTVAGTPVQLSATQIVLDTAQGPREFRGADLLFLTNPEAEAAETVKPAAWVKLVDGTTIAAQAFTASANTATLPLPNGISLEVPTRQIQWVRFHEPSAALADQWDEAIGKEVRGDRIIVRRTPQSINYLEGTLGGVESDVANFHYDGNDVPAPRERLEGLVYFHALKTAFPVPACRIEDANGSRWHAKSFEKKGDAVEVICLSNVRVTLPLSQIRKFDFSSGNLVYLSDLEPQSAEWTPWFASSVLPERLAELYSPKRDRSFSNGPMLLRERGNQTAYEKGLALHSRTKLTYRLTGEHRKLVAQVGMDARLGNAGHVELTITGDGRELFRREISGADDAFPLDLDIQGIRRLELLVDYGKNMDLADHLNLCDAMLTQ